MKPGRRLRLDRRKAGLSQAELAERLGVSVEDVSAMENDKVALTQAAQAFSASLPARVPRAKPKAAPKPEEAENGGDALPEVEEERDGPGPRVESPEPGTDDRAPRA